MKGQSQQSIQKNIDFFCDNFEEYNQNVQNLDTYKTIRAHIDRAISGIDYMLDIGNGGVFDYDVSLVQKIVGLDLFLDKLAASLSPPPNVTLKTGSALDIPEKDNSFDGVLVSFLIHHLVGKTVNESIINVKKAITEAHRVLKPGGKIVIAESCVSPLFYQFEKLVYPIVSRLIGKVTNHPATIQYPVKMLERMISEEFSELEVTEIPLGRWILIYGIKFPTFLAPVKLRLFVAKK